MLLADIRRKYMSYKVFRIIKLNASMNKLSKIPDEVFSNFTLATS